MRRRDLMKTAAAAAGMSILPRTGLTASEPVPLAMPPLLDTRESGRLKLTAQRGQSNFLNGRATSTIGYNGAYLGPVVRAGTGDLDVEVANALDETITTHWHGLIVPGELDGGPHSPIRPAETWKITLPVQQQTATTWFHTHVHRETASQVYRGLAGVLQIVDGDDDARGLPSTYGEDDLTLVIQDRHFDGDGRMIYAPSMPDLMHGFSGGTILVNGQVGRTAKVPAGVVRLRLLNGSNGRIYRLSLESGREIHLVATDGGLLDAPVALQELPLSPGERAEVLVDFGSGGDDRLMSADNPNLGGMMGMMGGMMGNRSGLGDPFTVLAFGIAPGIKPRITSLANSLGATLPALDAAKARVRRFSLEMPMMGPGRGMMGRGMGERGMMGRGMGGRGMMGRGMPGPGAMGGDLLGINGAPFDMERIDFTVPLDVVER